MKMDTAKILTYISKLAFLVEDRQKGKSLKETGYPYKYVKIYRAVLANIDKFNSMDYVTRSLKFATEHADHVAAVEDEKAHVLELMARAEDVYEAYNPGEYFYDGPSQQASKIVYRTNTD